jgi:hypothetical protein
VDSGRAGGGFGAQLSEVLEETGFAVERVLVEHVGPTFAAAVVARPVERTSQAPAMISTWPA